MSDSLGENAAAGAGAAEARTDSVPPAEGPRAGGTAAAVEEADGGEAGRGRGRGPANAGQAAGDTGHNAAMSAEVVFAAFDAPESDGAAGKGKEVDDGGEGAPELGSSPHEKSVADGSDAEMDNADEGQDEEEEEEEDGDRNQDRLRHSELIKLGAAGAGKSGKIGVSGVFPPGRVQIQDEEHMTRIPARTINTELTCPICLSIVRSTHTFMECMHRFCKECIEKYMRMGTKECPKCRVKVSSRRALRPDPAFDKIVERFYPDIDAYEEKEEEFISQVNADSHSIAAVVAEGLRRQATAAGALGQGGGRQHSAGAAIAAVTAANHAESRRQEAERAEARKREKLPATSASQTRHAGSAASKTAEGSVSITTLKRAASELPGLSTSKRQALSKKGAGSGAGGGVDRQVQPSGASAPDEADGEEDDEDDYYGRDGLSPPVTPPPPPAIMSQHAAHKMVEFRMFPHPNEQSLPPLEKDYMCSLEYCKCMVLKKYLASRLKAQLPSREFDWRELDLLVNTQEQENAVIPNDLTLGTVVRMLWSRKGELKILFRVQRA